MEVLGKIRVINKESIIGASFKKRELVVTTEEQYPQHIMIEFTQDKCDLLNLFSVGDSVKVGINLRGREWVNPQGESKYFNSIQAWRISKDEAGQLAPPVENRSAVDAYETRTNPAQNDTGDYSNDPDDLPF